MILAQGLFLGKERAAEERLGAQHGKEAGRHAQPRHLFRLLSIARRREVIASAGGIEDGHGFKRVTLPLEIPKVRRGDDVPIIGTFAEGFPHQQQPVRTGERQRLQ